MRFKYVGLFYSNISIIVEERKRMLNLTYVTILLLGMTRHEYV